MNDELAVLFAKRFIQRRDVKAVQLNHGGWMPDRAMEHLGKHGPMGFQMEHLYAHLDGRSTYGHYMLDSDDMCRMFALDIDLNKNDPNKPEENIGHYVPLPTWREGVDEKEWAAMVEPVPCDPRELWTTRTGPEEARNWFKYQMGMIARRFASIITSELGIPCAAAYSGGKGIHVYGFTGPMPAAQVRAACLYVLEFSGQWTPIKGQHFYGSKIEDPSLGYRNFSIETFPKQDSLKEKDLGNLMRLPLGRNLKSTDPTFFLDLKTPPGLMVPHINPAALLESGDPYL